MPYLVILIFRFLFQSPFFSFFSFNLSYHPPCLQWLTSNPLPSESGLLLVRAPHLSHPHRLLTHSSGTSSGFGKALVASVLARGDRVIATARTVEKIKVFWTLPGAHSSNLHLLRLDVSESAERIQKVVEHALSIWGSIDVVVNNAGLGMKSVLEEGGYVISTGFASPPNRPNAADRSLAAMQQFQTNVFGVLNVTNAVLPHMRQRQSGTVIIIGSRTGWHAACPVSHLLAPRNLTSS